MINHRFLLILALALLLVACAGPAAPPTPTAEADTPTVAATAAPLPLVSAESLALPPAETWWNDVVFYEIFVRSFYDSDGDGQGDLKGLIEKLDYLNDGDPTTQDDLGIGGIWLMPVMESVSYHGYDTVDYLRIERDYGSNADFKRLLDEAHRRGIRVILDLVLNHSSAQHPWFIQALQPDSPFHDWYVWDDRDLGQYWYAASNDRHYYAYFWDQMPDFNYRNAQATRQAYNIADFWLEMGVDGFRLDAIKHLIETDGEIENTPETHAWLAAFQAHLLAGHPDAVTVGEIFGNSAQVVAEYIQNGEVSLAFDFTLAQAMLDSLRVGKEGNLRLAHSQILQAYPAGQYATFITNHDQNRAVSQLLENLERAKVAATLLLTSPGVPFVYYGEEIGMVGVKPDEQLRTPMQWDDGPAAGFTTGQPWFPVNPDYTTKNVAAQSADPDALLNHYRALIQLRNEQIALRRGDLRLLLSSDLGVYSYLRLHPEGAALVVVNLTRQPVEGYDLSLSDSALRGEYVITPLLGEAPAGRLTVNAQGGFEGFQPVLSLAPYSSTIFALTR